MPLVGWEGMNARLNKKERKQPKFNKLITLLLLLGTLAFMMETEQRISSFARTNLSDWASLLPDNQDLARDSINPYAQESSIKFDFIVDSLHQVQSTNN